MKRRQLVHGAAALAVFALLGCQDDEAGSDVLDDAELEGLLYMRDEEKLARDVYLQLGQAYGRQVFDNIAESEQRHMDSVLGLLERYGVADPVAGLGVGELQNPELQALHDELIARGMQSEEQALRVGALIEEVDILDLRLHTLETDEATIAQVYGNLEAGSHNHLRAFVDDLTTLGVDYQPERLTLDDYVAIIAAESTQGSGQHGH